MKTRRRWHRGPLYPGHRKIEVVGECWIWIGRVGSSGYSSITRNDKKWSGHVWVWTNANGRVPSGFQVDHVCGNKTCVRLSHLQLTTPSKNTSLYYERLGMCKPKRHKKVPGAHTCRECAREAYARYEKRKEEQRARKDAIKSLV